MDAPEEHRQVGAAILAMLELGTDEPMRMLLDSARQAVRDSEWESALYRCHVATEQAVRVGDTASHATTLVCQAVVQLAMGHVAQAGTSYQRAAQLFHLLAQPANEAVASLGYSYTQNVLGDLGTALAGYQRARALFRALADAELRAGNNERALHYERRVRQVRELMDRVLISPVIDPAPARTVMQVAPVVPAQAGADLAEAALGYVVAREFVVEGRPFTLHRVGGRDRAGPEPPLVLQPDGQYFAIAVPADHWARLGVQRGDYVLLSRAEPQEGEGFKLVRTPGGQVDLDVYGQALDPMAGTPDTHVADARAADVGAPNAGAPNAGAPNAAGAAGRAAGAPAAGPAETEARADPYPRERERQRAYGREREYRRERDRERWPRVFRELPVDLPALPEPAGDELEAAETGAGRRASGAGENGERAGREAREGYERPAFYPPEQLIGYVVGVLRRRED